MNFVLYVFTSSFICQSVGFSILGFLGGVKDSLHYYSISPFSEQCDNRWVTENIIGLEEELEMFVFGQDLAVDVIIAALRSHSNKVYRKKPLVLNFHGWPGGGKGYVADFILKYWFKKGEESNYVRKYQAKIHFPLKSEVYNYQKRLQYELEETIKRCRKAMFVFDEVDKYPPHVLDGIKPYLDFNTNVNGHDFREAIFIFITNTGDKVITNISLQKWQEGVPRDQLKLKDFENALQTTSFNDVGGFYQSDLIRHHLIDHVVPFLPLERRHIESCVKAEYMFQDGNLSLLRDVISEVLEEMTFGPGSYDLYSINGCKSVYEKVSKFIERERKRRRKTKTEL